MAASSREPPPDVSPDEVDSTDSEDEEDPAAPGCGADEEWEEWQDDDGDGEAEPACSLFDATVLPSPLAAMDYDSRTHAFDLKRFIEQAGLDMYGVIQVINYIRSEVAAGRDPRPTLKTITAQHTATATAPWCTEKYLIPAKEDDALLFYEYDEWTNAAAAAAAGAGSSGAGAGDAAAGGVALAAAQRDNAALRSQVEELQLALATLQSAMLQARGALLEADVSPAGPSAPRFAPATATAGATTMAVDAAAVPPSTSNSSTAQPVQPVTAAAGEPSTSGRAAGRPQGSQKNAQQTKEIEGSYFDSYSGFNIHKEMISDQARTNAYREAIEANPSLIWDKTVMDVGCGTGILSLFACRAGAARVVSVEGSQRIASFAKQIAERAGYSADKGGPMHIVCSKVEDLTVLPGGIDKVDVIVSEWMGYALLFETMLDSVLVARDRWLRPGGVVLPDKAILYMAGAHSGALGLDFWKNVYGFSFEPILTDIKEAQQRRANVQPVNADELTTNTVELKVLDMCTMKSDDQDFTTSFTLTHTQTPQGATSTVSNPASPTQPTSQGASADPSTVEVAAVVIWFNTLFSAERCPEHAVTLSTSPAAQQTHWVQTVLPLAQPVTLAAQGAAATEGKVTGGCITGRVSFSRNRGKHRSLDIALEYSAELSDGSRVSHTRIYPMSVMDD